LQASGSGLQESCPIVFTCLDAHYDQRNQHRLSTGIPEGCAARYTARDLCHDFLGRRGGRLLDRLGDGPLGRSGGHPQDELRGRLLGRLQGCLKGRPLGNPLNRLRIGLLGRRKGRLCGRLAGRPYGRLRNRLVGRHRNHPDDDLWDDLQGNPWDEPWNRDANLGSCDGSRAGAKAAGRALRRPLGRSSDGAAPGPLDCLPHRSSAALLDVSRAGVLVRFRSCLLTGCQSGRDAGNLNVGGCRCWFGPGAGRGREDAGQWGQFLPGAV